MIVLGADTHKRSHTIAAVSAATGELIGEQTVQVGATGFAALVVWARELGTERVWALEDCRHVSGSFERFLIERGERVLRVTTKLMADSRRRARGRGKSDSIDAIAVARAALREGLDALPAAQLEGPELDLRLLVDHRERLVRQRVALNNTLQWHLHDIWPELRLPGSSLFYGNWGPRVARRLARTEQTMRVRIARDELRRIRELSPPNDSAATAPVSRSHASCSSAATTRFANSARRHGNPHDRRSARAALNHADAPRPAPGCSCRHDRVAGLHRQSGRTASRSTPSTIMSPSGATPERGPR